MVPPFLSFAIEAFSFATGPNDWIYEKLFNYTTHEGVCGCLNVANIPGLCRYDRGPGKAKMNALVFSSGILFLALSMFALVIAYNTRPLGALCPSIITVPFHFPFQILMDTLRPSLPGFPPQSWVSLLTCFIPFLMAFYWVGISGLWVEVC